MTLMNWTTGIGGLLFLLFLLQGQSLLELWGMRIAWKEILALLVVGVVIHALWIGQMSDQDALIIIGSILVGKSIAGLRIR